ncbi:MAG: LemA family protein [Spirochaetales bacterium]|nr:LemA family protein [Spirochaetales bacterium]
MGSYQHMKGRYSREDLEKIIGKAQALYGRENDTLGRAELDSTAEELDIPREYIERAIAELKEENAIKEKSRKTMRIVLGLGAAGAVIVALIVIVALVRSTPSARLESVRGQYYNRVAALDEAVKTQRAQVENVIQRRFELIPKLTELVREYARSESAILLSLKGAQDAFGRAASLDEKTAALGSFNQALDSITAAARRQPEMKSARLYRDLMFEIAGSDNRIAVERKRYNDAVGEYNRFARQYPLADYIEALDFAREQPYWEFDGKR